MKIYQWAWALLALGLLMFGCHTVCPAQASPYNLYVVKPQSFTATAQTGANIPTNGLLTCNSTTIASAYSYGEIVVSGTGLTTVSFQLYGSSDNGGTFQAILLYPTTAPASTSTTITATTNGKYGFSPGNASCLQMRTTGTFTAASVTLTLSLNPVTQSKNGGAGGGSGGPPTGFAGGDLCSASTYPNPQVCGLQNVPVDATTPAAHYVVVAQNATRYNVRQLTADDIAPGFTINTFISSAPASVEIGFTVSDPVFAATYSATPASAAITNTDSINSPFNLTTPFTAGTVLGNFQHTSAATTTFTLTAIGAATKTATIGLAWLPRTFGGVGAAGATSSVTAATTTAVLSNSAVLASAGLGNQSTYGAYSPSAQKIYILMVGGSHTFRDASTGFSFAFNSPTSVSFTNVNGSVVAMFLYESTNTLTGTFSITVAS